MSYASLVETIRQFPYVCDYIVRVETFDLCSVTREQYDCHAEEHLCLTIDQVTQTTYSLYDDLEEVGPISQEHYVRCTWKDDFAFTREEYLPWALIPARKRVHVYSYVRLRKNEGSTDLADFRWLILTDCVIDALAHVRAERAWEGQERNDRIPPSALAEIEETEPETYIAYPEGWAEIESGTEPEPEPQPEPKAPAPSLANWHTPEEREYLERLPRYTLATCLITVETAERVGCGWRTFELPPDWEEARAEVQRLSNDMYAAVCGITYVAEDQSVQDYDSEIHYQWYWNEDRCQIGLLKLHVSWELKENQLALEWQDPDSVLHALQPVWIASQKINSLNSVWDRIQTETWQERQFAADWLRGGAHCYSLMIGESEIEGYHSLIEFGNDSHKAIELSVGNWQGKAVRLI